MSELLPYFKSVNETFWGDDVYQWLFYTTVIIILLLGNKRRLSNSQMAKRVFAVYPICFIIALFNPITYAVTKFFTGGAWMYYARLYSMLPIPYTLALGAILLIDWVTEFPKGRNRGRNGSDAKAGRRENRKKKSIISPLTKLLLTAGLCVFFILGGTNVYSQDWMRPAQNIEKVPNDVIELLQALKPVGNISVAVPDELSSYVRQVEGSLFTPYGRYVNSLGEELASVEPDVSYIMTEAGKQSVNYVVVRRSPEREAAFADLGYEPTNVTDRYAVYAVSKVPRLIRVINEKHQIVEQYYLNADDQLECEPGGCAITTYEYDKYGHQIKETYLDEHRNKYELSEGYASISRSYRKLSSLINSISYLDAEDQKILHEGCYETRYKYNFSRRVIKESYYDALGNPMNRTDVFYAVRKFTRNKDGRVIKEEYFDTEGSPILSSSGFASCTREYNEVGRVTQEKYYGIDGMPILVAAGYVGYIREFDERGNQTSEAYIGTTGSIAARNTGYAQVRMEYDDSNRLVKETYWDEKGNPYSIANGSHGFLREYDEAGNGYIETYIDANGQEIALRNGYSRVQREYDENNQLISEIFS